MSKNLDNTSGKPVYIVIRQAIDAEDLFEDAFETREEAIDYIESGDGKALLIKGWVLEHFY